MPANSEPETPDVDDAVSADAAEAAAAAAEARAEAARARANELRAKLDVARDEAPAQAETETETTDEAEPAPPAAESAPQRKRGPRALKAIAATLAVVGVAGLAGTTGYMVWQHRAAEQLRHRSAEFSAAARQGVVNLMSLDYTHAKETVQRVIDDSTGKFKSNFEDGSGDLIKALQDAKVSTKVTVNDSAVESMDENSATVLVAATSQRTGPDAPKEDQQPRVWRVVVSLVREGDQLKMADVEFV
ncbi:hypothetical protein [Mycobacterium sp. shizuoka-1]|uniref:hypothetical protein n=1 Tax=Mycobacterium sp. shizuoka-1 TaxID=2039281 RepID=UPI000C05E0FC|nr:hypothetical protein [Mycobacterium sp. shizuoka-1]GAY15331.1 hypothetical protein MSZK_20570 [Mycobacterium sp. shizuoka-1]